MQGSVTGLKYKDVGEALFGGDDSVNLMETMGEQWNEDRSKAQEKELDRLEREMQALEDQEKMANERHDFEMALLKMQESDLNKRLEQEKKIAAGPSQKDAMFTGGSVEEFMFLRRQTQENETARAVKEAEDRAAEQRRQIEADRKAADDRRDSTIRDLKDSIDTLATKISNLD
jgi:hypothetical protein